MKKRWICLFVENEIGVLARIAGLFSAKAYNLESLTVGRTEDEKVSRMTISLTGDDKTFEQVKKQLNRCVEVIKVVDYTDRAVYRKELMYVKISGCSGEEITDLFRISRVTGTAIADYTRSCVLLESVRTQGQNEELLARLNRDYSGRIEIARGGSVAVEAAGRYSTETNSQD